MFPFLQSMHNTFPSAYKDTASLGLCTFKGEERAKQRENRSEKVCIMEVKVTSSSQQQDESTPLLSMSTKTEKMLIQSAISQTFKSTANLANLLPTGTVLAFQLLSPIFTNQGDCDTVRRYMIAVLLALCGLSCILTSFTDSFKDTKGNLTYGFATIHGLWVIDGTEELLSNLADKYRFRFIDFLHAFMSLLVFIAVALFDDNTVKCFFSSASDETEVILEVLPVGIGVICSMLFVAFPTKRHGIGYPFSTD